MAASQEGNSTFLVHFEGASPAPKELKEMLEKGDVATKVDTMKKVIMLQLNGEPQNHLIMSVIKFCVPQEDHTLKKLLIYFWECVEKTDENGNLLSEMILVCNFLRTDLQHPNEYIRGITLRFLCKLRERDIVEPLVSAVVQNLTHRVTYVRRNAVLAVHTIYQRFPQLLPDAPEMVEKFLQEENDVSAKRNAFIMLFQCAQDRAVRYLAVAREQLDMSQAGEVFQLAVVDLIKSLMQADPFNKTKYVPIIFSVLQSKSPAVLYQGSSTLLALSSSPTAIKHATSTFIHMLTTHSDNNVRLIVLDRLADVKKKFPEIMQESLMDLLRGLSSSNLDIRKRIVELSLELTTQRNVEGFVQFLKKELVRSQDEDMEKTEQQEYRQLIVNAIRTTVMKHPELTTSVVNVMLDYVTESGASAYDVILFLREVMNANDELRGDLLTKLAMLFGSMSSPKVMRTVLWLFGVHCKSVEEVTNVVEQLRKSVDPLPLAPLEGEVVGDDDEQQAVTTTTVREDGTYVTSITMVDKRLEAERADLTGVRAQIISGDYFLAATLCNTLAKLVVEMFGHNVSHSLQNTVQADAIEVMRAIITYGTAPNTAVPIEDDAHERIRLSLTVAQNPRNDSVRTIVADSHAAYNTLQASSIPKPVENEEEKADKIVVRADQPIMFTQLMRGPKMVEFDASAEEDIAMAVSNQALEKSSDFLGKLHRVMQLTGFADAVYAEANVTIHQFDIAVEMYVVNQTSDVFQNLTVELATIGDLKLCERPQSYTLQPYASATIRANIKVSSTETGVIFGNIVYDVAGTMERGCIILNEVHIDIMDYINEGQCSAGDFRSMWVEFEWENKVAVHTEIRNLREYIDFVTKVTNMKPIDDSYAECGESAFLSTNLYAKSLFGEDALANVSIEISSDGKIEGFIRIRSKTQGIALGLGEKLSSKQKY